MLPFVIICCRKLFTCPFPKFTPRWKVLRFHQKLHFAAWKSLQSVCITGQGIVRLTTFGFSLEKNCQKKSPMQHWYLPFEENKNKQKTPLFYSMGFSEVLIHICQEIWRSEIGQTACSEHWVISLIIEYLTSPVFRINSNFLDSSIENQSKKQSQIINILIRRLQT